MTVAFHCLTEIDFCSICIRELHSLSEGEVTVVADQYTAPSGRIWYEGSTEKRGRGRAGVENILSGRCGRLIQLPV